MKKVLVLFIFALISMLRMEAQITNDSATIKINPGATLYLDGDLNNLNQSVITNEGTLEVKGEFNNELGSEFNSILTAISIIHGISVLPLNDASNQTSTRYRDPLPDPYKRNKKKPAKIK